MQSVSQTGKSDIRRNRLSAISSALRQTQRWSAIRNGSKPSYAQRVVGNRPIHGCLDCQNRSSHKNSLRKRHPQCKASHDKLCEMPQAKPSIRPTELDNFRVFSASKLFRVETAANPACARRTHLLEHEKGLEGP